MNLFHRLSALFFFLTLAFLLQTIPSRAWDDDGQENVLVFDGEGENIASFHVGDWSTAISGATNSVDYEEWQAGSPPTQVSSGQLSIPLSPGQVAVPNMTLGSSVPPPSNLPSASLYSFGAAIYGTEDPGTTPGLIVSPASGTYDRTIGVAIKAVALSGSPVVEIWDDNLDIWADMGAETIVYISQNMDLLVRGRNGAAVSSPRTYQYTINQPLQVDSDGDGLPDIWEIANGFDPLASDHFGRSLTDSDNDKFSDFDELLRNTDPHDPASFPVDTDGDGWSDWDEELRGLSEDDTRNPKIKPKATRLYEVEAKVAGTVSGGTGSWDLAPYTIENVNGQELIDSNCKLGGAYGPARIPMGTEAFVRAVQVNDTNGDGETNSEDEFMLAVSRYLPMIPDPHPADVTGSWTTAEEWMDLFIQYLREHLVVTITDHDVTPTHRSDLALLARSLELEANVSEESWFGFGTFGHEPTQTALHDFRARLAVANRSLNQIMEDISLILAYPCTTIQDDITGFSAPVPEDGFEQAAATSLHDQTGTYLAALVGHFSHNQLVSTGWEMCLILDPANDLDNDSVPAFEEISLAGDDTSPFSSDSDQDGVPDADDNCGNVANSDQDDGDGDGIGDGCDDDWDNDGLSNGLEMAIGSNPYNEDTNDNGIPDGVEWGNGSFPGVAVFITEIKSPTNQAVQTISGYRFPGTVVSISSTSEATLGNISYPTDTSWSCTVGNLTAEGEYLFNLMANTGDYLGYGSGSIIVDLSAPVSISEPVHGSVVATDTPVLMYTADDGVVEVYLDGLLENISSGENLPRLPVGDHSVRVEVTDEAGNSNFDEVTFTVDESSLDRRIAVTPASISFSQLRINVLSQQTVTVSNSGQTPVTIGDVGAGNTLAAPFSLGEENCSGVTLAFEETCSITVELMLTEAGEFVDSFDLPNNDPDRNPVVIPVVAQAVQNFPWSTFYPAILRRSRQ